MSQMTTMAMAMLVCYARAPVFHGAGKGMGRCFAQTLSHVTGTLIALNGCSCLQGGPAEGTAKKAVAQSVQGDALQDVALTSYLQEQEEEHKEAKEAWC